MFVPKDDSPLASHDLLTVRYRFARLPSTTLLVLGSLGCNIGPVSPRPPPGNRREIRVDMAFQAVVPIDDRNFPRASAVVSPLLSPHGLD